MKKYIILLYTSLIVLSLNAQSVKRSYKTLAKGEYLKAKELFTKNIQEESENAAANLGMALILGDEKSEFFNILDAWEYAKKVEENKNSITSDELIVIGEYFTETEVRRTSYPVKKKINFAVEAIEARLIKYIREENDLEATYELLERYPDFKHYDNVIHIRNQFEFRKYEKMNTLAGYQEFVVKFPDAAQVPKAKKYIHRLLFQEVKNANSVKSYNDYIKKYPKSEFIPTAIKLRNTAAFSDTRNKNTIEAYDWFIGTYPDALEVADAKRIRTELVYNRAKSIKSLEGYNDFIREYPEGKFYIDIFNLKSEALGKIYANESGLSQQHIKWSRAFDNNGAVEEATALCNSSDGGYILAGSRTDTLKSAYSDVWILKLDATGTMIWNKEIGLPYNDRIDRIFTTSTNDIICIGYTQINPNDSIYNGWMFKLSSEGKKIWNKNLGDITINSAIIDNNDDIYMSSISNSIPDTIIPNYYVQSFNLDGVKEWERSYVLKGTVNDIDFTYDNKMLLTGSNWVAFTDEKKYLIYDQLTEDMELHQAVINSQQQVTLFASDSVNLIYSSLTQSGIENWTNKIYKTDSAHSSIDIILDASQNIISFERNLLENTIRKISSQGNLFPEIVYSRKTDPVCAISNDKGELVLLLKADDIVLFCLQIP